ncbi:MAG: N-acetylmuramoyl-L-alanine amidase [Chloroflexi bacterium]|nr:N-acetylmuramoyl-L-alanine amidase [Chloroflexota bacterium]
MDKIKGLLGGSGRRSERERAAAEGGIIKEPPMEIDGRVMTVEEFVAYVEELDFPPPLPNRIFLHHTWKPTVESWRGRSTILAMKAYYERQLWYDSQGRLHEGWTAGPHIFVAPDGIWLFSDLRYDGVGVYGNNYRSRHVEMVGNYDQALPTGAVLENTIAVLGILHDRLGLDPKKLAFHRDFSTKSCPGWAVKKGWIIPQVEAWMEAYRRAREAEESALRRALKRLLKDLLKSPNRQAALAQEAAQRGLLGPITDEIPMEIDDKGYIVQVFAEALVVPANEWERVQSLKEFEEAQKAEKETLPAVASDSGPEVAAPPTDPYHFTGEIR